ncbi:hypothetical protein EN829_038850, partial [Mesorhizobium sp. M00.F.Ca.ET.186.01.1.1]
MYFANKTNCQVGLEPFSARLFCAVENLYRAEILLKIDHFTQEPLAGVTFDLLDADDKVVQSGLATNAEGKITVPNLKAGSYQFMEKTTLPDYQLAAPLKFDLVDEGTLTLTLTNKLIPGSVKLTKVRAGYPNHKLKGAVFTLEDETGQTGKDKDGAAFEIAMPAAARGRDAWREQGARSRQSLSGQVFAFRQAAYGMR